MRERDEGEGAHLGDVPHKVVHVLDGVAVVKLRRVGEHGAGELGREEEVLGIGRACGSRGSATALSV